MSSKQEDTGQKCTRPDQKINQLKDRIDELECLCLHCVSRLCEAGYDDGNHPVVNDVIKLLRSTYFWD